MRQLKPLILFIGINFGCGGKAEENSNGGGSPPSTGGMSANTGGTANGGSPHTGGDSGDGDTIVFSGGSEATGGDGGAGGAAACSAFFFWYRFADEFIGGLGPCGPDVCNNLGDPMGTVIFDDDGELIEVTGLNEDTGREIVEVLAAERWPCLATETSDFCCHPR